MKKAAIIAGIASILYTAWIFSVIERPMNDTGRLTRQELEDKKPNQDKEYGLFD